MYLDCPAHRDLSGVSCRDDVLSSTDCHALYIDKKCIAVRNFRLLAHAVDKLKPKKNFTVFS